MRCTSGTTKASGPSRFCSADQHVKAFDELGSLQDIFHGAVIGLVFDQVFLKIWLGSGNYIFFDQQMLQAQFPHRCDQLRNGQARLIVGYIIPHSGKVLNFWFVSTEYFLPVASCSHFHATQTQCIRHHKPKPTDTHCMVDFVQRQAAVFRRQAIRTSMRFIPGFETSNER